MAKYTFFIGKQTQEVDRYPDADGLSIVKYDMFGNPVDHRRPKHDPDRPQIDLSMKAIIRYLEQNADKVFKLNNDDPDPERELISCLIWIRPDPPFDLQNAKSVIWKAEQQLILDKGGCFDQYGYEWSGKTFQATGAEFLEVLRKIIEEHKST